AAVQVGARLTFGRALESFAEKIGDRLDKCRFRDRVRIVFHLCYPCDLMSDNVQKFIDEFAASLSSQTFVKLTLGNYKGVDKHLQKVQVRLVKTKKGTRLFVLYRSDTRDTVKNYDFAGGRAQIGEL